MLNVSATSFCFNAFRRVTESPPVPEMVAPPKKRRLPRESLSTDTSPPATPTSTVAPSLPAVIILLTAENLSTNCDVLQTVESSEKQSDAPKDNRVEICSAVDSESPTQEVEPDAVLAERVIEMRQQFGMPKLSETTTTSSSSKGIFGKFR